MVINEHEYFLWLIKSNQSKSGENVWKFIKRKEIWAEDEWFASKYRVELSKIYSKVRFLSIWEQTYRNDEDLTLWSWV